MNKFIKGVGESIFWALILTAASITNVYSQVWCGGPQGDNCIGGESVPELDGAFGPIAVAVIAGMIGIGIELKRRKNKD